MKEKKEKKLMFFPFLEGEVIGLKVVPTGPSNGSFGLFVATEVLA